ncbi:MAG TPA: hypothetical protein VJJ52_06715 [Candidatus Nanoarchaeia archaeon]|nr:hypothetical protein [Candidatus Nanoarchaeia archaeon]
MRFVESEKFYSVDNLGNLHAVEQKDYNPLEAKDPQFLVGDIETLQQYYARYQQEGKIPNLSHPDNALEENIATMSGDEHYLSREFKIENASKYTSQMMNFSARSIIKVRDEDYGVLINFNGEIKGGALQIGNVFNYQIAGKNGLELRQVGASVDRWYSLENLGNGQVRQKMAVFDWDTFYKLDATGIRERLLGALKNQQVSESDIRRSPNYA